MKLYAHARVDLGLSEQEFWEMAPQVFEALSKQWMQGEERKNLRAGLIAATIVNVQPGRKRAVKPSDFFRQRREAPIDTQDLKQILTAISSWRKSR